MFAEFDFDSQPLAITGFDDAVLFTPAHGYAAFTVPHLDQYLKRAIPELSVPAPVCADGHARGLSPG